MSKPRGREHSTLTETAALIVRELTKVPGIKMIAPGEINTNSKKGSGARYVTAVFTTAGMELIISGQSVQKVAVHTDKDPGSIFIQLQKSKRLRDINFNERGRERKPGV